MAVTSHRQIQILHVDDEPDFADLTGAFLEREDDRFTVETATSAEEGLDEITDCPPDCVVSDYNMPGMDGLEFLQAVREDNPDLPFILYTGKGSEAVASDAIAADVTDYLQKGSGSEQYELLANRIRNAVRARREAERADRQEQLMRLTEFAGDTGGFEIDAETGELLLTDGTRRLIDLPSQADLTLDEAVGLYHPEDRADIRQTIDHARQTGERTDGTWRLQTQGGNERIVEVTIIPAITGGDTEILRGSIHDITEQHERQEELKKERRFITQALDALDDLFYLIDTDGTLRRWNERALEVTGHSESELDGMPAIEFFPEDERERISTSIETTLTDGEATVDADLLTADGQRTPFEFRAARLTDEDGSAVGLVGIGRDLTERRQRDRRFRALVEESNDVISILDADGRYQYQSPSLERILGYDTEETVGETAWEYIHPDDRERILDEFETWVANPDQPGDAVEYRARDADGSWRWMEAEGNNQLDNPAVEGYVVNSRDITERKERQRKLERTTDLMSNMEQLADAGAWEYDSDTDTLVVTGGACRIYGLESDSDLTLEEAFEPIHPEDRKRLTERFDNCLDTGESYEIDVRLTTVEGTQRWVTARGERVSDDGEGSVVRGYIRDVTDQRAYERDLERYRTVFNELPDPAVVYDEDGRYEFVNDAAAEIRDTPREELTGTKSPYLEQIRKENPGEYDALVEAERDTLNAELTAEFSGVGTRTLECRLSRLTEGTKSDGVVIITRDITDRKERERQLSRERQRYTTLFETLPNPVLQAGVEDGEPVVEMVNPAFEDVFGYDVETIRDEPLHDYILPDDRTDAADRLKRQVLTEGEVQAEIQRETTEGVRTFRVNVTTRNTRTEDHVGYAVYTDITGRKRMEHALEQERDLVTGIVETAPVGITVCDADGSISFVNEQMESISGRSLEDLEGDPHDDSRYDLVDRHAEPLRSGETPFDRVVSRERTIHSQVVGIRRPSGERVWLSVSGAPQYGENGELERAVFAFEDITEQRELEAELSEMFGRISDGFFALDEEFRFTHVNSRAEQLVGASENELLGETPWEMFQDIEENDEICDGLRAAIDTQESQSLEFYSPRGNWYDASLYPSESGLSVYFRDVTERKKRDREVQELKSQYETLVENFPDGAVYLIDTDLQCVRAGGEELSRVGLSPDDVESRKPHALFPEEVSDEISYYLQEALDGKANTFEQEYGGERYRIQTVPVRTDDETIDHVMAVSQNITERAEDKQNLEAQNERLEEFASIVSHDLRGPLSVAEGNLELARENCESDHLARATDALDRSQTLIEDLLKLAREGETVGEREPVDLADVAEHSWQTAETGSATLETHATRTLRADRSRLQELFENLYRNAIEHGGDDVRVSVGVMGDDFYVADTGPGIPKSDREEVFEAGYSTNEDGTGFGLRIVEQIADAHGWEVAVTESEEGGARFEITGVDYIDR